MDKAFMIKGNILLAYTGSSKEVSVPEGVVKIGGGAFSGCGDLAHLMLPSSVAEIADFAFRNCVNLETIDLPEGITKIGERAFIGCKKLAHLMLPNSVAEIAGQAFKDCTRLEHIDLPKDAVFTGEGIFEGCTSLKSVVLPADTKKILKGTFQGCTNLSEVNLPDTVTQIEEHAFDGCTNLKQIIFPDSVKKIQSYAFHGCSGFTDITLPKNITCLNAGVFQDCTNLTNITIPEGVKEIQKQAFGGCTKLKVLNMPASLAKIEFGAYSGGALDKCEALEQIVIAPENPYFRIENDLIFSKDGSVLMFCMRTRAGAFEVPENVQEIAPFALSQCDKLTQITIPDSVATIGSDAFHGCTAVANVTLPANLEEISPYLFRGCTSLRQIDLPLNLVRIGKYAFDGAGLETLVLPASVKELGNFAFQNCPLQKVTVLGETKFGAHMLGDGMFELYAWKIPLACIHKNYEKHAILTFADCYLSEKEIPEEYRAAALDYIKNRRKRLYDLALEHVSVLQVMIAEKFILWTELLELLDQAIQLGNPEVNAELLEYQNQCFGHIDREQEQEKEFERELKLQTKILETGIVPVGVMKKSWSYRKKEDGTLLVSGYKGTETQITVPAKIGKAVVTEIGEYAFSNVSPYATPAAKKIRQKLESVVIPKGITKLGACAFFGCGCLANVELPEGITEIGSQTFWGCCNLASMVFPSTLERIAQYVFDGCKSLTSVTFRADVQWIEEFAFPRNYAKFIIYAPEGSYVQYFANRHNLSFRPISCK